MQRQSKQVLIIALALGPRPMILVIPHPHAAKDVEQKIGKKNTFCKSEVCDK